MFQDKLPTLADFDVIKARLAPINVEIEIEARRCLLSDNPKVAPHRRNAWRYIREGSKEDAPGPLPVPLGPVFDVRRGCAVKVTWINELGSVPNPSNKPGDGPVLEMPPVNALDMEFNEKFWRRMNPSVGVVTHLHGAKVEARSDGWPLDPVGFQGNPYGFPAHRHYTYANDQRAAMLWFHDHAMDNTSPQVHAGLAGLYFVRDDSDDRLFCLIGGADKEIPLVIQDRKFDCGFDRVNFWAGIPTLVDGPDPENAGKMLMTFDRPEFLGETIVVNGRPAPFATLARQVYRLRILNGSNARTYALALIDPSGWAMMGMNMNARVWYSDLITVIGNDGGLMPERHALGATEQILLAPGERLDVLLDLTGVDPMVSRLRLVNLALGPIQSLAPKGGPEGIFQTTDSQDFSGGVASVASSLLQPLPQDAFDTAPLATIGASGCANILEICMDFRPAPAAPLSSYAAKLDEILLSKASEDGFEWTPPAGGKPGALGLPKGKTTAVNRFVLLMNATDPNAGDDSPYTGEPWRDTQMWELTTASTGNSAFPLQFDAVLDVANPAQGGPSAPVNYFVARSAFFKTYPASKRIDEAPYGYAPLNENVIKPKEGTYERWYVANIGNQQPVTAGITDPADGSTKLPDMHPFHMHLVNFVVTRRFLLQQDTASPGSYVFALRGDTALAHPLNFDGVCRHDTVRVEANELVELLVWFPDGYKGKFPYHCHLVEHEDMGMMSHFEVV